MRMFARLMSAAAAAASAAFAAFVPAAAAAFVMQAAVQFFFRCVAHILDFHIKEEFFSGKRMVCINYNDAVFYVNNGYQMAAFSAFCLKLHTGFNVNGIVKLAARHLNDQFLVILAVSVCGLNDNRQFLAGSLALKLAFKPRNQIAAPVDILKRSHIFRRIEYFPVGILKHILNRYNFVLFNLHGVSIQEF